MLLKHARLLIRMCEKEDFRKKERKKDRLFSLHSYKHDMNYM
jgi:hypothetical protein